MKIALTYLVLLFASSTFSQTAGHPPRPYKIAAIKALLFYEGKGTFSRDTLAKPDFTFWNTIIGEGDAGSPSNSTLVLVEVTGNSSTDESSRTRRVEFTAVASGKVLLKRTVNILIGLSRDGDSDIGIAVVPVEMDRPGVNESGPKAR